MEKNTTIPCPKCNKLILYGAIKDPLTGKYIGYTVCRNCRKEFTEVRYKDKAFDAMKNALDNLEFAMNINSDPSHWFNLNDDL